MVFWLIALGVAGWVWFSIGDHTENALSRCMRQADPVLAARLAMLSDDNGFGSKQAFQRCRSVSAEAYCKAAYLDAHHVVGDCMQDAGYWFEDANLHLYYGHSPYKNGSLNFYGGEETAEVCDVLGYEKSKCYHDRVRFVLQHPWTWRGESADHAAMVKAWRAGQ
jgi:hypothetical protein